MTYKTDAISGVTETLTTISQTIEILERCHSHVVAGLPVDLLPALALLNSTYERVGFRLPDLVPAVLGVTLVTGPFQQNKLRVQRARCGMSQTQAGVAAGLTQSHYSRLELGKSTPTLTQAQRLAKAFGCVVDDLT